MDSAQEKKPEKPAIPGLSGNKKPQLKPVGVGVLVVESPLETNRVYSAIAGRYRLLRVLAGDGI